jgi:hypothetical protein
MLKKFNQKVTEGFLFIDQYELVMAQLYFKMGVHEQPVQFEHFFRDYPDYGSHKAGYCINAGLEWFVEVHQQGNQPTPAIAGGGLKKLGTRVNAHLFCARYCILSVFMFIFKLK